MNFDSYAYRLKNIKMVKREMNLTKDAIELMGFTEIPAATKLEVYFYSALVYHVEGIVIKDLLPASPIDIIYKYDEFSFALGNSINAISNTLCGSDFVDNEEKWVKEKKVNSPYFIILFRIKDPFLCKGGYWKKENEIISTYNSFPEAKNALKEVEHKVIPSLLSCLTIKLTEIYNPIRFKMISHEVYGKTTAGENLHDYKTSMTVKVVTAIDVSTSAIKSKINESMNLYQRFNPKIASLFHSAMQDDDRFKKFLNLFQAIEIHTHQTFKNIDFNSCLSQIHNIPDRIKKIGVDFFVKREAESKNLTQRFIWCALLVWKNLEDNDIEDFKKIKKIRDEIAHGEKIPESTFPISKAEKLLLKIIKIYL
jgi:hypothetical protein